MNWAWPAEDKCISQLVEFFVCGYFDFVHWASCRICKIAGAPAPGMPGTFSPSLRVSDPDMHHGTCVTHVPWCMPRSLTSGFLRSRRWGKTFPACPAHAHTQFYVSGKRPIISWFEWHWYMTGATTPILWEHLPTINRTHDMLTMFHHFWNNVRNLAYCRN